jgi:putative ABC transport system ATP-binding protein
MTYPGQPPVHALRPCELSVSHGEYIAVVGPSGSGKSTLLNILGLLDRATEGTYELDGIDVATISERERTALRGRRIGFVFQAFHLLPHRTAMDNVALAQLYTGPNRSQRHRVAVQALTRVGLANRINALPTHLSGGERQRVAIARALVNHPSLLLCDEPTGNLDSATASRILSLVDELQRDGLTVVIITHDPAVAARAHRTITLRDGILANGESTEAGHAP